MKKADCFIPFVANTEGYALPELFTFPFYYEPHPLSLLAAKELQTYIENQTEWTHNFGFEQREDAIGKMFGVLVVRNNQGKMGYLAAFSGKLAGGNHHARFVPPVFDILEEDGFFRIGEAKINEVTLQIEQLEKGEQLALLKAELQAAIAQSLVEIEAFRVQVKAAKIQRDTRRIEGKTTLADADFIELQTVLSKESVYNCFLQKDLARSWKRNFEAIQGQIDVFSSEINDLRERRKIMSAQLQQQIFDKYTFLNQAGERKNLTDIFPISGDIVPPAGAGECAAPKLMQYAFLHQMTPIALAEFWWGQSPSSEIRQHGNFYPACKSKCEPILGHMLEGIKMDENPMLLNPAVGKTLATVFEDEYLIIVNKPTEFFSVPGRTVKDSVQTRLQSAYADATGPMIVHRLDVSTSGLILLAKTKDVHQNLQSQFLTRRVKKRYVAILEGIIEGEEGLIDLPLRGDMEDRPRQLVCYEHGKRAQTHWKVLERRDNRTKIEFFPITGRTHQLRVHAAHPQGLNTPIVGDDLYGTRADRLYLHAENLEFVHPITKVVVQVAAAAEF